MRIRDQSFFSKHPVYWEKGRILTAASIDRVQAINQIWQAASVFEIGQIYKLRILHA